MTEQEFERAARTYGDMIFRVACHAVKSRADAEDVTQTVLLKLYRQQEPFESEAHLKHWLLRLAVNESRRLLGSPWRKRVLPLEGWDGAALGGEPGQSGVLQAVLALEPKYRLSIYLYYYEGLSVREVAQALRAKESTVQTWLQRAREKLRGTLQEEEGIGYV